MTWFNRILPSVVLFAFLAALTAGFWRLQDERREAQQALAALKKIKQERTALARQAPAPTEENERAIDRDLADATEILAAWRAAVVQGGGQTDTGQKTPTEAYFEIAAFVERMRGLAADASVELKPDECFGFARHTREGPASDLVPAVLHQCFMMQELVEALIDARPLALLAVHRQRPAGPNQPAPTGGSAARPVDNGSESGDFFDCPEPLALRAPKQLATRAFRLEFSGQTQVLRTFLNNLVAGRLPVFVRSVEVEPLAAERPAADTVPPVGTGARVPLVARNLSRFTVVVETIELMDELERPAS
jgi:hypothetical protein